MLLKADEIARLLRGECEVEDRLYIAPDTQSAQLRDHSGAASVDLRLGCWFAELRHSRMAAVDSLPMEDPASRKEAAQTTSHYVPFGSSYVLQPGRYVLGVTLEWLRLPGNLGGYVTARSSLGRRGLIIATAVGVHPGFTGCLTLELSNVGSVSIMLRPGLSMCQLFLHTAKGDPRTTDRSLFVGLRRPILGDIRPDATAEKLGRST